MLLFHFRNMITGIQLLECLEQKMEIFIFWRRKHYKYFLRIMICKVMWFIQV